MLKKFIKWVLIHLPVKKVILFESCPDLSDNTKPVFDELVIRGYNKKYKMIWMCYDSIKKSYPKIKNVEYLDVKQHHLKASLLNHTAKATICCNRFLGVERKKQTNFYLCHGSPLKDTSGYYTVPKHINYIFTQGEFFTNIVEYCFRIDKSKIFPLGFPRNDALLKSNIMLNNYFGKFQKYIVWYPTVRQFKGGKLTGSHYALPILHDVDNAIKLNDCARKQNCLIILKPHFAQDVSYIKELQLSNIIFIADDFFKAHNITSYEFVAASDALLTDYSSIYCDYLLCNKPIGLIWEDIDEYVVDPGLVPNYQELCSGGEKIYNIEDLIQFVERISNSIDLMKQQRNAINECVNAERQEDVTANVVDFIANKIAERN